MNVEFKFAIGDLVYHRLGMEARKTDPRSRPLPLLVLERRLQEYSGGLEISYTCRGVSGLTIVDLNEIEIVSYADIPQNEDMMLYWMNSAKEWACAHADWDLAANLRDAADRLKANLAKPRGETQP